MTYFLLSRNRIALYTLNNTPQLLRWLGPNLILQIVVIGYHVQLRRRSVTHL
jgi:hypothetical protein